MVDIKWIYLRRTLFVHYCLSASQPKAEKKGSSFASVIETQRRVVPIQRDYFHSEFCIAFPSTLISSGVDGSRICHLKLEAFLLDADGIRWRLDNSGLVTQTLQVRLEGTERRQSANRYPTAEGDVEADFSRPILNVV